MWIVLRILRQTFLGIWSVPPPVWQLTGDAVAIFDGGTGVQKARVNYVEGMTGEKVGLFMARTDLLGRKSIKQALIATIFLSCAAVPVLLFAPFSRYGGAIALLPREMIETTELLYRISSNRIRKVHFFCSYEKDSNIIAFLLMRRGVAVNKIPSTGPLSPWYHTVVATSLTVTNGYQREEVHRLKDRLFVSRIQDWSPAFLFANPGYRVWPPPVTKKNTLGFYSSGYWLRKELGKDIGLGGYETEEALKAWLRGYKRARPGVSLHIYPHPMEKASEEVYRRTWEHYHRLFEGVDFSLADRGIDTLQASADVDLALGVSSTALFERLYCGLKVLFSPPRGGADFPVAGSALKRVCAFNRQEIFERVDAGLALSREDYFRVNGLDHYPFYGDPSKSGALVSANRYSKRTCEWTVDPLPW